METERLTLYSHGSGCGCKIDPGILNRILAGNESEPDDPRLLVGNTFRDDAAVIDLGDGTALISTTDFFMPILDDPFDFGRIASANAISDIYAMGGHPLMAVAILGWPVNQLAPELASRVMVGARSICREAGIPLAGGHSIDSVEPFFGLAVNGRVDIDHIKRNAGAQAGDLIYLTKPLGIGIMTTASKLDRIREGDLEKVRDVMIGLNRMGEALGEQEWVHALTDVTGFGLIGHLLEICKASDVSAVLDLHSIPLIDQEALRYYLRMQCAPAAAEKNWASFSGEVNQISKETQALLSDPQTSGGLLVCVAPDASQDFERLANSYHLTLRPIGSVHSLSQPLITVVE